MSGFKQLLQTHISSLLPKLETHQKFLSLQCTYSNGEIQLSALVVEFHQRRHLKHGLKPMESRYKAASDYSRCTGPHCRTGAFSGWAFKYRNHVPSTRTVSQKAKLVHLGISPDLWPLMDKVFALADALSVPMLIYSLNGASIVVSQKDGGLLPSGYYAAAKLPTFSLPWSVTASFASLLLFLWISASKHTGTLATEHRSSGSNGHS